MVEIMTKRRASGKINEELVCVDSFVEHLKKIDSRQKITVLEVEERNEPPDFWVTIAGVKYAVEVTSITDYAYDVLCEKLIKTVCSRFEESGMKGTYDLRIVGRPDIPKRGTTDWRTLVSTAVAKIQKMSDAPCGAESCLLRDANGDAVIVIQKTSAQGSIIWRTLGKWEGEAQEELSQLFKKAIEKKREGFKKKREQLEKKGVLDWDPTIILVFYDAYGLASIEDMKKAFLNVQGYEWLHSIFLAVSFSNVPNTLYPDSSGRKGVFLYSKKEQWR
jgi:hypothetical protein